MWFMCSVFCRHLLWKCENTVGVLCFFMLQCLPGSPGQEFRFHDGQLVLLGVKQTPPPFQSPGIEGGVLRSLRLPSGGGEVSHAGSSSSRMVLWCPGGGKVHLLFEVSPHLGEEERVWAAQRDGGRRLAGRAGLRKQESRGGATGERGRSCDKEMLGRLVSAV